MKHYICGHCRAHISPGAVVCAGCQGTVVYGATNREIEKGFRSGALLGAMVMGAAGICMWGASLHTLIAAGFGAAVLGVVSANASKKAHAGHVRTRRRF
jgi:hypothetical protein